MVWWCPSVRPSDSPSGTPSARFPHFSHTCFDILSWNFAHDFVLMYSDDLLIQTRLFPLEISGLTSFPDYWISQVRTLANLLENVLNSSQLIASFRGIYVTLIRAVYCFFSVCFWPLERPFYCFFSVCLRAVWYTAGYQCVCWSLTSHAKRFQLYMWRHRCAGGLKKKLYLHVQSGSQRHRYFVGFFNVPVQAPTHGHPFYTVISRNRPM